MEIFKRNIGTFRDEFEDDDFYDELRRQVLILTEEEEYVQQSNEIKNSNRVQMRSSVLQQQQPKGIQFYWYGDNSEDDNKVPKWLLDLWRKGNYKDEVLNGTGVFIPHIIKSRRRNKSRRKNTERGKAYKPVTTRNC
ncbi:hypothetical protein HAX54_002826 [Datura stramonium]|uniref:Uncharacterized protein n=1 Tax=Datura stramonium TaxID=4076 RepID=A0ABS8T546_DATST|nr:hypothetical protein [Datura stramonium]